MLTSHLEILEQARAYLSSVSRAQYTEVRRPQHMGSAGAHMRHIFDHYQAVMTGLDTGLIDYDLRQRGHRCELDPVAALSEVNRVEAWLRRLDLGALDREMKVRTEVSIRQRRVVVVATTLARELVFVGSHAVHHFATIGQIACLQGVQLEYSFGIAPATATSLRGEVPEPASAT